MKPIYYQLTPVHVVCLAVVMCLSVTSIRAQNTTETDGGRVNASSILIRGSDANFVPSTSRPLEGGAHSFRFEDAPAREVVHAVLSDMLKAEYVLHSPLETRITIVTPAMVTSDQALYLLEAALHATGNLFIQDGRGVYHVGKPDALRAISPNVRTVNPSSRLAPGFGAIVVPLKHIGATEMAAILRPLAPGDTIARVDTVRNLLVLVGSRAQAEGWLSLVETFDVDLLKAMSVGVFPLKHVTVKDVDAALQLLSGGSASVPVTAQGAAAGSGSSASIALQVGVVNPLAGLVRVLPIERINSVIVVAPRAAMLDEARRWIERLDKPGLNSAEPQLHVYPVKNGSAKQLADVLNGIFGGQAAAPAANAVTGVAPGLPTISAAGQGAARSVVQTGVSVGATTNRGTNSVSATPGASAVNAVQIGTAVRVVADENRNALIIYAPGSEMERIETALQKLDTPAKQVLIEASIVEVTLTDELSYGTQWMFGNTRSSGATGTSLLTTGTSGAVGGALAGFSYTLRSAAGSVRSVLNALADKSLVKVISTPSLMVLDNNTATIVVGNQQPIRSTETVSDAGVRSTSIQYKDTGVSLLVKPSVNAGDMVTMSINQAVTDVGAVDTATGQRAFLQRQIDTKVAVRSGETLVLGGLIRDNDADGSAGVPGLHDIPLLGALFGTKTRNRTQTELLVIITPRILETDDDLRAASLEMRSRMRQLRGSAPIGSL